MRAFVLRAEFGKYTDVFKDHNYIGFGFFGVFEHKGIDQDWSDKELLKDLYKQACPDDPSMRVNQNVGQVMRFVNEMKLGDIVITPYSDSSLLIGQISSELYYEEDSTTPYPW